MKYGLRDAHLRAILDVLHRHGKVEKAVLFGSRAMGTHTPESDVDICLFGDALTLTDQAKLIAAMEELSIPQQVDLLLHRNIKEKALLDHIRREGKLLFERERSGGGGSGMGGGRHSTVSEYVTLQRGTTYKGMLVGQPGPALLGLGSIEPGGGFREGNYKTYGGECPPNLMLVPGDLYVALKGATKDGKMIGSIARVPPSVPSGRLTQDTVKLEFRDSDASSHASYLYWVLRTPQYRDYCAGHATGSAVVALSRADFLTYPVPPPTPARIQLVVLLEDLERKIALNRRINETLEAMARALFKSWFVDFDPVRAKAEGRQPSGMDAETAKLFPSEFEESELGEIPKGWRVSTLKDETTKIGSGATPRGGKSAYIENGIALIRSQNVYDSQFVWKGLARITDEAASKLDNVTVEPDDVLLNITGASILRTCVVEPEVLPARVNQHVAIVRAKAGVPPRYIHFHLLNLRTKDYLMGMDAGASRQAVTKGHIESVPIVVPSVPVLARFDDLVRTLFSTVDLNNGQSRRLAEARDALLPRLLSGELTT